MTDDKPASFVDNIFSLANRFATPFAQNLADKTIGVTDDGRGYANQLLNERLRINALNGSGAADPYLASQAPQGILDVILGQGRQPSGGSSGGGIAMSGLTLIVLVALLAYFMRRR